MVHRELRPLYPVDAWRIREVGFDPANAARNETIFSLANGHLGLRGNLDEDAGNVVHGTYVNGFYEETPITYSEAGYGFAHNHQVLLNVADGKRIGLWVGNDPLDLATGTLETHERSLDLRTGVLSRSIRWRAPGGTLVDVASRRIVSLTHARIAAIEYSVTVVEGSAPLRIVSAINTRVHNQEATDDPRVGTHLPEGALSTVHREASGMWGAVVQRTRNTRLAVVAAAGHELHGDAAVVRAARTTAVAGTDGVELTIEAAVPRGGTLVLAKTLAYGTSLDDPEEALVDRSAAGDRGRREHRLRGARGRAARRPGRVLDRVGRRDRRRRRAPAGRPLQPVQPVPVGRPRRAHEPGRQGPHRRRLRGPLLLGHGDLRAPVLRLQPARDRAVAAPLPVQHPGHGPGASHRAEPARGALSRGGRSAARRRPPTSRRAPRSTTSTRTSRTPSASTSPSRATGRCCSRAAPSWCSRPPACGPTSARTSRPRAARSASTRSRAPTSTPPLVNNNGYTNLMARAHLRFAARLAGELATEAPEAYEALATRISARRRRGRGLAPGGGADADPPRRRRSGIHLQDDAFLNRAPWDFAGTPADHYPLLLHYHPLVLYRHQVLKQSDLVLAQVLLGERVHDRREEAQLRLLRPAHDRRLLAVPVHPERRGGGARLRRRRLRLLHADGPHGPRRRQRQRARTGCTSRRWPGPGCPSSTASAGCVTTTAGSPSRRGCPPPGTGSRSGSGWGSPRSS